MNFEQWLYTLPLRLRLRFRRKQADQELIDELRDHLEQQIKDNVARGMSPEDARYCALRAMGGITQIEQQCRDARGGNVMEDFVQDLRYGCRQLCRSPGFSVLAILCLTLGIGANAAVFSWVEGILFRPYPAVTHQERLVALAGTAKGESHPTEVSWPDFLDVRRSCTLCDELFVSKITGSTLSIGDHAESARGSIVSANYFDAIGVHPILGRGFEPDEEVGSNSHPVVVISYQLWRDRFKGDPQIIGKVQRLDNVPHTIIGVAPEGFYGTFVGWAMQFWVPASMEENFESGGYKLEDRGAQWVESYARLKPGVTRTQAQQEVSAIAKRLENRYPATNRGRGIGLWPLWQTPFNNAGTRDHARRGGTGAPHRLRQCRQPSAGAILCPSPRNERSARHWSQPCPIVQATSHRRPDPCGAWRGWRTVGGVLVPARFGAPLTGTRGSGHVPARENRLACDRDKRRNLPGRYADCRSVSRIANPQTGTSERP
jgi:hypothetical protein